MGVISVVVYKLLLVVFSCLIVFYGDWVVLFIGIWLLWLKNRVLILLFVDLVMFGLFVNIKADVKLIVFNIIVMVVCILYFGG